MGLFIHKIERSELVAGDHIYTWRAFIYSHHGIYIGEGKVVHFVGETNGGSSASSVAWFSSSSSSSSISVNRPSRCPNSVPNCGFRQPGHGVLLSCLDCFLVGGSLHRYEYGVPTHHLLFKIRAGTHTTAKSDPPEEVIYRTMYLLQQGCFGVYNVITNNCEHFTLYCKTGCLCDSGQVDAVRNARFVFPGFRGVGKTFAKVPVEVLSLNRRSK